MRRGGVCLQRLAPFQDPLLVDPRLPLLRLLTEAAQEAMGLLNG